MRAVVVLSGPTSGLGRELLKTLLSNGLPTIAVGRRLERLTDELAEASGRLVTLDVDLADLMHSGATESLDHRIESALEQVNAELIIFVNNAGVINPIGLVGDISAAAFQSSLSVNLLAPMILTNACARSAKRLEAQLVVLNVSSGAALRPLPGWSSYCATKAAARMYFEVLAAESPEMVDVDHIDPGVLDTAMQETIRASSREQFPLVENFAALKAEGRLKSPAIVANEIVERVLARIRQ